jgi:hypothetical protein
MPQFSADEAQVASAMAGVRSPATPQSAPEPPVTLPEPEPVLDYREFDPKHREAFTGLLYVGHLDHEFQLYGHTFRIATPTQTERLQVGPVVKEFRDTITNEIAYQAAVVALYLVSIDGQALPQPILANAKDAAVRDRFNWVTENMRRPVINAVFDQSMILEDVVDETLEAMGKASA